MRPGRARREAERAQSSSLPPEDAALLRRETDIESSSLAAAGVGDLESGTPTPPPPPPPPQPRSVWGRIKYFFTGDRLDRDRIKALGLGAVASYGFVSNSTYGVGFAASWIAFVRQTGNSPLMSGQWKGFLAFYAGFWTLQNFIRPLRFTIAVALAPSFDKFITRIEAATGFKRRNAFAVYLFILGAASSILIFGSIRLFAGDRAFARV